MGIVVTLAVYAFAFAFLSVMALIRARRGGGPLRAKWLASFGMLGMLVALVAGSRALSFPTILASATVAVCAASDLSNGLIYNVVVGSALAGFTAMAVVSRHELPMLDGLVTGLGIPLALHLASGGRGIGAGDVKLFAVIGSAFGATGALAVIGMSFVMGASQAVVMLARRKARLGGTMAFAPFIALGTMSVACAGLGY